MAITYKKKCAVFEGLVAVDEADDLLQWIQKHPQGKVDLAGCTHLHAANLQVLMATKIAVSAWPGDADLKTWLSAALMN